LLDYVSIYKDLLRAFPFPIEEEAIKCPSLYESWSGIWSRDIPAEGIWLKRALKRCQEIFPKEEITVVVGKDYFDSLSDEDAQSIRMHIYPGLSKMVFFIVKREDQRIFKLHHFLANTCQISSLLLCFYKVKFIDSVHQAYASDYICAGSISFD
jgi:hypothetical protein